MWELYDDDESFQRMARGRGVHDAKLLARVLYGKKTAKKSEKSIKVPTEENKNKGDRKGKHIQFKEVEGRFLIDSSLMSEEDEDDADIEFLARTRDYTFQPVKTSQDFLKEDDVGGVMTDVCVFDRNTTSEFDKDREELKDDLVAWNIRYQNRNNK